MKKTISLLLSLLMALSVCFSMACTSFAADKKYELPGKITGHKVTTGGPDEHTDTTVDDWDFALSYNKSSKILNCTCTGTEDIKDLLCYLYSLSTDAMSNRFFDQENTTILFAEENNENLFSIDPIRFGKIKRIDVKEKANGKISPLMAFSFTTKNNKVTSTTLYTPNSRNQLLARSQNSFSYNKNGLISKVVMTNQDPDYPDSRYKVESTYTYDSQNRPTSCLWKMINTQTNELISSKRVDYSHFNNVGWPTSEKFTSLDASNPESETQTNEFEFDANGRLTKDYWWNYSYDSQGRLSKLTSPASDPKYPNDGGQVTYSSYFTI